MINRRDFLQRALSGSAALPLALSFPSILSAAQSSAKNVIFIHMPDGINPDEWHPSADMVLGKQNSALESVKQHCIFLRGVDLKNSPFESGTNHDGGTKTLLTNFDKTSINVKIGEFAQLADSSITHPYLLLGLRHNYQNFPFSTSYKNASSWDSPILPEDNPRTSYASLFGEIGASAQSSSSVDLGTQRRLKALAHVQAELQDMKSALGAIEQAKLSQNLDAISDLRSRINLTLTQSQEVGTIDPASIVDIAKLEALGSPTDLANIPDVSALNNEIAVAALALGKTRSVTLNYSHNTSEMPMPWIDANSQGHAASHAWGDDFNAHRNWYASQLADLINKLKAVSVDGGTLLDNTMIIFGSDVSHSNGHGGNDMPFIVAGGGLQGGRILSYSDTSHEQLLVSAAQFAGMDIDRYGYHFGKTGALSDLLTPSSNTDTNTTIPLSAKLEDYRYWAVGGTSTILLPSSGSDALVDEGGEKVAILKAQVSGGSYAEMSLPINPYASTDPLFTPKVDLSSSTTVSLTYSSNTAAILQLRQTNVHGGDHNQATLPSTNNADRTLVLSLDSDFLWLGTQTTTLDKSDVGKFNFAFLAQNESDGFAQITVKSFVIDNYSPLS